MKKDGAVFRVHKLQEVPKENTRLCASFRVKKCEVETQEVDKCWRSLTAGLIVMLVLLLLVIAVFFVCFILDPDLDYVILDPDLPTDNKTHWFPDYESESRLGIYKSAAVSTDAAPCAAIGKDILERNGTAVDAAIAVLLCMGVVNPQNSGIGGGFLMLYYNRSSRKTSYIEARERAPLNVTENMFEGNESLAQLGILAIAVPGEMRGYLELQPNYSSLSREELFKPAIKMCREGIPVTARLDRALKKNAQNLKKFEHIWKIFRNNETGEPYQLGENYTRPKLAETLEAIVKSGFNAIYDGKLGKKMREELENAGSIINRMDFGNCKPKNRELVKKTLRKHFTLNTVASPGSGSLLALVLGILDGFDDIKPEVNYTRKATVKTLHRMIESFKFAFGQKMELNHNLTGILPEIDRILMSNEYANDIRKLIDDTQTFTDLKKYVIEDPIVEEDNRAAQVSIIAPNGDAVAATSTINSDFGSMVVTPSTGIIWNNQMNAFTLFEAKRNTVAPGKRPCTSMTPAIITDANGDVVMAIGGTGGNQIITSLAQVIFRILWFGENIKQAVDAPRFHHQLKPNHIVYEEAFPEDLLEDLKKMGHEIQQQKSDMLGTIMGVVRKDDYLHAYSDYRTEGDVDGF